MPKSAAMTVVLWFTLPDTPDKDIGLSYFEVVSHLLRLQYRKPDAGSYGLWPSFSFDTRH